MLNRINPLDRPVQMFEEGGPALLSRPAEMSPEQSQDQSSLAPEQSDPFTALYDVLGEELAADLQQAMEMHPSVVQVAEMAIKTTDGTGSVEGLGESTDDVPARLNAGEFIFSKEAVDVIGLETLEKIHEEAKRQAAAM